MIFYDSNHKYKMIPIDLLETHNTTLKPYSKDQFIFNELDTANFYYQIKSGKVKMSNITENGKEFIQGFFEADSSFGEPPLLGNFNYPASAVCLSDCLIYVLPKLEFISLLKAYPDIHLGLTEMLCKRMHYKAKIMKEVSIYPAEHRILTLLHHLKHTANFNGLYEINLTRQQISELTGLRVETVIRAIKKLEKSKEVSIIDRKVYV